MIPLLASIASSWQDWLAILSIPVVSAGVGWITNVLALKMTFYPLRFVGIGPLGWQGIIPAKAGAMAGKAVDILTQRLITIEDRFEQIDPEFAAAEMAPALERLSLQIVNEAMEEGAPLVWENAPPRVRQQIYQRVRAEIPAAVSGIFQDLRSQISDLFDLRGMVVEALEKDRALLNEIFLKVGEAEFHFIERSGFYFGFLFGLPQMGIFLLLRGLGIPAGWTLPLAGLLVGWATNYLALRMIFEPLRPQRYGPFVYQGLFLRRQQEVAAAYARIVTSQILTSRNIFAHLAGGPFSGRVLRIVREHVKQAVDEVAGLAKPLVQLVQGTSSYVAIRSRIASRFAEEIPHSIQHVLTYAEKALDIENTLRNRMQALPPEQFEGFLRPVFQEDEWKLILAGAVLGLLAGLLQWVAFFVQ
jgi:uncharacterized membrane protein YheB (UPF0754 family)